MKAATVTLFSALSLTVLGAPHHAKRQNEQYWAVTAFEAYNIQHTDSSDISFNLSAPNPLQDPITCFNRTLGVIGQLVAVTDAPCGGGGPFTFSYTPPTCRGGDALLNVTWHFTSHGAEAGLYSIPADEIVTTELNGDPLDTSVHYVGPTAFNITDFEELTVNPS